MKNLFFVLALGFISSSSVFAHAHGSSDTAEDGMAIAQLQQAQKDTFLALLNACGGDCDLSGAGWQVVRSAGPMYVECKVLTADVAGDLEATPTEKFNCSFHQP